MNPSPSSPKRKYAVWAAVELESSSFSIAVYVCISERKAAVKMETILAETRDYAVINTENGEILKVNYN